MVAFCIEKLRLQPANDWISREYDAENAGVIVVRLKGGLGNQMFQYAFGRAIASRFGQKLYLDIDHFNEVRPGETVRKFELDTYKIRAQLGLPAFWPEIVKANRKKKTVFRRLLAGMFPVEEIVEEPFGRQVSLESYSRKSVYLDGYWQNENLFLAIRQELIDDFTIELPKQILESELFGEIKNKQSVAVHVRRGDYVTDEKTNKVHGVCSIEYFQNAISYLKGVVGEAIFCIFSDDIEWCRKNFEGEGEYRFVDFGEFDEPHIDLKLMSLCKHNVISNSSFSWWAGWLNENAEKVVVAPKTWFLDASLSQDYIVPASWVRL